ncbi:response regulator [Oceanibacterium hippocampi]|uniref:histidine kinase n=1 Tax=Oceanibacterium hippocampi TaxID=745714 RepID=A0A1Y5TDU3_9PROT|nr:response regulator [Oceanibacterium hippocampi]SLN59690.1 Signal transduction histidine-protein kinase BarA [Oceanibacterium hippocampi]
MAPLGDGHSHGARPGNDSSVDPRILSEQIDALFRINSLSTYKTLLALGAIALVFWPVAPVWIPIVVLLAHGGGTVCLVLLAKAYQRNRQPGDSLRWARVFSAITVATGGAFGLAAFCYFGYGDTGTQAFLLVVVVSVATGSAVTRSAYLPAFYVYIVVSGVPVLAVLATQGDFLSILLALLGIVYFKTLIGVARENNRILVEQIRLRFENSEMVESLKQARADAERAREEAEIARDAAEAGNRAKTEFLATMSHELRTPLNGILGMAELLLKTPLDGTQRGFARTVMESGRGLLTLIGDILDFSKIEADKIQIEATEFDPGELLVEVVDLIAPAAWQKGLEFALHVDPAVPALVVGDAQRLRQVILNIAGNAIKFTDTGAIAVTLAVESIDDDVAHLVFVVRDTGSGIPESHLPYLFERFVQGDASYSRQHGGTGLGLAICLGFVRAMGGMIGVRTLPGVGSSFRVDLPFRIAQRKRSLRDFTGRRILFLHPVGWSRDLTIQKLRSRRLEFAAAADVAVAVRQLREGERPDAIVVRGCKDAVTFRQTVQRLREACGGERPILLALVNGGEELRAALAVESEIDGHLLGPLKARALDTAFSAIWPAQAPDPAAGDAAPLPGLEAGISPSAEVVSGAAVLVVDDVDLNRKLADIQLTKLGHRVAVAADGDEAIAHLAGHRPDLVLLDIQMPKRDGFSVAREIRRMPGGDSLPIVAMTAHTGPEYEQRCLEAGMDGVLTKPFHLEQLRDVVVRWARGRAPRRDDPRLSGDDDSLKASSRP